MSFNIDILEAYFILFIFTGVFAQITYNSRALTCSSTKAVIGQSSRYDKGFMLHRCKGLREPGSCREIN